MSRSKVVGRESGLRPEFLEFATTAGVSSSIAVFAIDKYRRMSVNDMATIRFEAAIPQFTVPDVVQTAEYYRDTLSFHIAGYWNGEQVTLDTDPPPVFGIVSRDEIQIFFNRADEAKVRRNVAEGTYHVYLRVTGIDALAEELRSRRADILDGPEDRVYGQRELVVRDCNGIILCFGESTTGRPI